MKPRILLYTHTDCHDVWPLFFGQLNKYAPEYKLTILCNNKHNDLPSNAEIVLYNDSEPYTKRLRESINKLNDDVFLFIHEDMILTNHIKHELISKYTKYIYDGLVDSIKLIYVSGKDSHSSIDSNLIKNESSKFSIQPTLIKKEYFLNLLNLQNELNIWDFETKLNNNGNDYMVKIGGEIKRGKHHYDSLVFPYIATAIVKGKWNFKEYPDELEILFKEYNLTNIRN